MLFFSSVNLLEITGISFPLSPTCERTARSASPAFRLMGELEFIEKNRARSILLATPPNKELMRFTRLNVKNLRGWD
jgi:hypothetical protein